jgi:hypothetical protein
VPRCPLCKSPLTFAGVSPTGESVYACTTTLYRYDKSKTIEVPCTPDGFYYLANGQKAPKGDGAFAKRDKKGNVQLPRSFSDGILRDAPQVGFAREYVAKLAKLDDLPHAIGIHPMDTDPVTKTPRPRARLMGKPVPAYIREAHRRSIEAWARSVNGIASFATVRQSWRRAVRAA